MTREASDLLMFMLRRVSLNSDYRPPHPNWTYHLALDASDVVTYDRLRGDAEGRWIQVSEKFEDPEAATLGAPLVRFRYDDTCRLCNQRRDDHGSAERCPLPGLELSYCLLSSPVCACCEQPAWEHANGFCAFAPTRFKRMNRKELYDYSRRLPWEERSIYDP